MNMFNKLPPFKWFVLQNFPFIEADFDAITNYQLLCKIVEYLNLNIDKTNELGEQVEALTNWFNNLDVQDEIDNKLDDMAESGQLAEIINEQIFNDLNDKIDYNAEPLYDTIIMGDSYALGQGPSPLTFGWADLLKQKFELDNSHCYIFAEGGVGFVDNTPETFLELLQSEISSITEPNKIKNLIIAGGYNDKAYTFNEIQTKIIEFASYVKTNLPNATIYIGHIGWNTGINGTLREYLIDNSLRAYSTIPASVTNMVYLNGVEFSLIDRTLMQSDYTHPNLDGLNKIADNIYQSFKTGNCTFYSPTITSTMTPINSPTSGSLQLEEKILNNVLKINLKLVDLRYSEDITFTPVSGAIEIGSIETRFLQPIKDTITVIPVVSWIENSDGDFGGGPAELLIGPTGSVKLFPFYVDKNGSMVSKYNHIRILATSHTFPLLYN